MGERLRSSNVVPFPRGLVPVKDDYRERMRCNLIALVFTSTLLLASCWVIDALVNIPSRDCNFSVRRPCSVNLSAGIVAFDGGAF